ncbi:MAG: ABC-2 family transporter protein [Clostridia bacterium]|nr:ABC-2 family transporter protein [Clostridia bacterium]
MLTVVKNYFRFMKESIKCNLKGVMEYKKSFLIQSVFMFFNNFFFLIFWFVIFNGSDGNINGITMNDILYLWSLPVISFGTAFFFFGGISKLGQYILEGGLDTYLTQPKNVLINVMVSGMDFSAFGDLIYGLVIGLFAVEFNILKYVILVCLGIIGAIFYICVEALIRLLTIKIGNTDNIEHICINTLMITFASYPEAIYGKLIKMLIYTVIPSAYIAFIPIKFVQTLNFGFLLWFLAVACGFVVLTAVFSKQMLKKYESGNNIAMRG